MAETVAPAKDPDKVASRNDSVTWMPFTYMNIIGNGRTLVGAPRRADRPPPRDGQIRGLFQKRAQWLGNSVA
ncbi:hypothetical protein GCM10009838_16190 [Catenulispora subtropica]|uniref:Uncharacterized protein n=1 Tax=Catenulispora subtropica TaxID=450798 RepID=A0ABP5C9T7_9ACTN